MLFRSGISRLERPDFQIEQDVAAQEAMVEHQIHAVMPAALGHAKLPRLETKATPQFEEEVLQAIQQHGFEFLLGVVRPLGQPGELEDVGIAPQVRDRFPRRLSRHAREDTLLAGGKTRAFVEETADLALQLADGPVAVDALAFIERPLPRIVDAEDRKSVV